MADDICDWLAKEEADAEEWGGLGGAQYYRKQFAAARTEIERLRTEFSAVLGDAIAKDAENERLQAAGDEMADAATRQQWSRLDVAVAAWNEARRG